MSVVTLKQPLSATEADRQRFEAWAGKMSPAHEASSLLARSKGGDYVNRVARGAWAAWQARGMTILASGKKNALADPRERVLALEAATRAICESVGEDPADGTMMLLTAAVHMAMTYSEKPMKDLLPFLAETLGHAASAADGFFSQPSNG